MISSKQNPLIKAAKKLTSRKGRRQAQAYLIEGPHLLEMAVQSQQLIKLILVTAAAQRSLPDNLDISAYTVEEISPDLADYLSQTPTTQAVFAVVAMKTPQPIFDQAPLLILDQVQDPGNVGTLIRTAAAFNYGGLVLGKGSVDLYNEKTLRSAQGSHFYLNCYQADLDELLPQLQAQGYQLVASNLDDHATSINDLNLDQAWAIILGNEGQGVSQDFIDMADSQAYIPMGPGAESLNVAVAGGIFMQHFNNLD
ncbi:hypothetical protein AWM75_02350 [Aerococcus urinaehominis]|uniref:Uncharacterized protein n=1 Tax=Aerococcus urinaehominis TaxID=128944 RepID=A0A120IAR2_9LACT|nr:RNA methyltransferase [Aerococcus urinaehominis]AMB98903.1 hypothetical protein AWM75_02350 [Aerococcus urinaehominis]SDM60997.1 RNA methyltransferase, TrmH family [Aerococcus urinaehominis]